MKTTIGALIDALLSQGLTPKQTAERLAELTGGKFENGEYVLNGEPNTLPQAA
jgi:hypothetical protein